MIFKLRWVLVFVAVVALSECHRSAWAIPTQPIRTHYDDAGKIAYPTPAPADPDQTNHTHIAGIGVKEISIGGIAGFMADDATPPQWVSESCWDNRTLRYADANSDGINDLAGKYGHGYIDTASFVGRPRYRFDANDFGAGGFSLTTVQQRVTATLTAWNSATSQQAFSRTTPDGLQLSKGIGFADVGTTAAAEIFVDFIPNFQTTRGAVAEWVISPTQQLGGAPALQTLAFDPNPTARLFVNDPAHTFNPNASWQVSSDGGTTFAATTPAIALGWNLTAGNPTNLAQTIRYKCVDVGGCGAGVANNTVWNGNEAAFTALGLQVADTEGGALGAATNRPLYQADFLSVSLHEWGHVLGLLDSPAGIMSASAPFTLNNLSRIIDVNNAKGAAVLYSVPVPEPATVTLLAVALFGMGRLSRSSR